MRLLPALLAALVCAASAQAQGSAAPDTAPPATVPPAAALSGAAVPDAAAPGVTASPVSATTGPAAAAPTASSTAAPQPAPALHARMTWQQRFAQANTTHDGHLTAAQAQSGYQTVARHFHDIDLDNKGYVTEDDMRAWHKAQRAAHRAPPQDRSLQPQHAFQRTFAPTQQINTAAGATVAQPTSPLALPPPPAVPPGPVQQAEPAPTGSDTH